MIVTQVLSLARHWSQKYRKQQSYFDFHLQQCRIVICGGPTHFSKLTVNRVPQRNIVSFFKIKKFSDKGPHLNVTGRPQGELYPLLLQG
jgi:hypothetical protein